MINIDPKEVFNTVEEAIDGWHSMHYELQPDRVIVTDDIRKIRKFNEHRTDIIEVVKELTITNTEMWH